MLAEEPSTSTGECQGRFFWTGVEVGPHVGTWALPAYSLGRSRGSWGSPVPPSAWGSPWAHGAARPHLQHTFSTSPLLVETSCTPLQRPPGTQWSCLTASLPAPLKGNTKKGLAWSSWGPTTSKRRTSASGQTLLSCGAQCNTFHSEGEPNAGLRTVLLWEWYQLHLADHEHIFLINFTSGLSRCLSPASLLFFCKKNKMEELLFAKYISWQSDRKISF